MSVDWARVFFHWQTEPIALLGLAIETYAAGLYAYGVVRLRRTGRRWPTGRLVAFMSGIIALALVLQSGFAGYDDDLLWVHMSQHLVLMSLAAPLLALGAPVRLSLAAGSAPLRRGVADLLHDPSLRLVSGTTAAILLPLDYYGSMAAYTLSPAYRFSEVNAGFHEFVHLYFLACGLLFWVPLLGADPATWRPSRRLKVILVALGVPAYVGIAALMVVEGRWLSPAHSVADIRRGALLVLVAGVVSSLAGTALVLARTRARARGRARSDARSERARSAAPVRRRRRTAVRRPRASSRTRFRPRRS